MAIIFFFFSSRVAQSGKAPRICLLYCLKTETCIQGSFITFLVLWRVFLCSKLIKKGTMYLNAPLHTRGVLKTTKSGNMGWNFRNHDGCIACCALICYYWVLSKGLCRLLPSLWPNNAFHQLSSMRKIRDPWLWVWMRVSSLLCCSCLNGLCSSSDIPVDHHMVNTLRRSVGDLKT